MSHSKQTKIRIPTWIDPKDIKRQLENADKEIINNMVEKSEKEFEDMKERGQIDKALDALINNLGILREEMRWLEEDLEPVLLPSDMTIGGVDRSEPDEPLAPLALVIRAQASDEVAILIAGVKRIRERLEL
jgi:hypothetical protein